jgi:hypothetical protein
MLPDDASIEEVAMVFGVHRQLKELTPAARKLTKGQMVKLLGAENELGAVKKATDKRPPAPAAVAKHAKELGLKLTVEDIQSVQKVFGSTMTTHEKAFIRKAVTGADATDLKAGWTVYVCCCPCCCATTELEPSRAAVA